MSKEMMVSPRFAVPPAVNWAATQAAKPVTEDKPTLVINVVATCRSVLEPKSAATAAFAHAFKEAAVVLPAKISE